MSTDELNAAFDVDPTEEATPDPKQARKSIDPEDDRKNWPTIMIDGEDGKPNYEFLSVSGTKKDGTPFNHDLQVMRGEPVAVPPSIVNMLNDAVETRYRQVRNATTGKNDLIPYKRSAIPWRLVKGGKYF